MRTFSIRIVSFILFCIITNLNAQISLPSIFSSNMVLQQKSEVSIWGWCDKNTQLKINTSWNKQEYLVSSNNVGEWKTSIKTPIAGGPYQISIADKTTSISLKNILIGEVWICAGQSNMEMPMKGFTGQPVSNSNTDILKSKNPNIRLITVPRSSKTLPQNNFKGEWVEASPQSVANFSATGYYFGRMINQITDVPIGLICVSYGGSCIEAWMSKAISQPFENKLIPKAGDSIHSPNRTPTVLFNGMLNPVIGYGIRGAIWYQGETNYKNSQDYKQLFYNMVSEWRSKWGIGEFPFYYAQIAPFDYDALTPDEESENNNSGYLRDAQRLAMDTIPNCGMAVLLDLGEKNCIHPANKQKSGERLAYWALAKTYGIEGFGYASPEYNELSIIDSTVTISFKNAPNGITSYEKEVTLFEIAGDDHIFHSARCVVRRKSVVLSSPLVKNPVAVRYAFKNYVEAQIFNTEGLPLSSFRTDNWILEK